MLGDIISKSYQYHRQGLYRGELSELCLYFLGIRANEEIRLILFGRKKIDSRSKTPRSYNTSVAKVFFEEDGALLNYL